MVLIDASSVPENNNKKIRQVSTFWLVFLSRYIFWAEKTSIIGSRMDGSRSTVYCKTSEGPISGLALDHKAVALYWTVKGDWASCKAIL